MRCVRVAVFAPPVRFPRRASFRDFLGVVLALAEEGGPQYKEVHSISSDFFKRNPQLFPSFLCAFARAEMMMIARRTTGYV